jgi:hypothetical protein
VNRELQAELRREHLLATFNAHLASLHRHCTRHCFRPGGTRTAEEETCLGNCYGRLNSALQKHLQSLSP